MSAVMAIREQDATSIEELLYQWGDECRSQSERLGLPASSGIARVIQQQRVIEQQRRGVRRKRPKQPAPITLRDGTIATICACGMIYLEEHCPRCKGDPQPPDRSVHATETRSFRPLSMTVLSANTTTIDVIVAAAPGWMQKCLRLSYLFRVRDSKAAQQLRIRTIVYREQREAAAEYVAERMGERLAK